MNINLIIFVIILANFFKIQLTLSLHDGTEDMADSLNLAVDHPKSKRLVETQHEEMPFYKPEQLQVKYEYRYNPIPPLDRVQHSNLLNREDASEGRLHYSVLCHFQKSTALPFPCFLIN